MVIDEYTEYIEYEIKVYGECMHEVTIQQKREPPPPYRPKIIPGKGHKRKNNWKRIRSNPKQR